MLTTPTGVQTSRISNRLFGNQQSNLRAIGLLIDEQGLMIAEVGGELKSTPFQASRRERFSFEYCDYRDNPDFKVELGCPACPYDVSLFTALLRSKRVMLLIPFGEKNESRCTGAQVARFYTR